MFENVLLFEVFGIAFRLATCLLGAGVCLITFGVVLGVALFKHTKGTVRRLDQAEAARVALYGASDSAPQPAAMIAGKAVGAEVEISAGIDDLRQAARAGDWLTFWFWPCFLSSVFVGVWCVLTAVMLFASSPSWLYAVVAPFFLLVLVIAWFMPWAAIYTNIDQGTAKPRPNAETKPPS